MRKKWGRILSLSGSIMAFHVGSGFASGQEILQFYTAFGPYGGTLVGLTAFALFTLFAVVLLEMGRTNPKQPVPKLYQRLGGTAPGNLYHWLTPVIMALVLCVTIAGGGATLETLFGLPVLWGRLVIAVPVLLTVWLGLRWITLLSGSIGPIIIFCALCLGLYGIGQGRDTMLWSVLPHTSKNWAVSAVSYACFGTITQIPFLLTVGEEVENRREAVGIAVIGNGGYMLTGILLHWGLYRSLPQVLGEQLPALQLARRVSGLAGWFYGVILLFSIYTTAVPLLWSVSRTVQENEKGAGYRAGALVLTALAVAGSQLPFDRLLGILYPYIGYVSALFFAVILVRTFVTKGAFSIEKGHKEARAACSRQTSRNAL